VPVLCARLWVSHGDGALATLAARVCAVQPLLRSRVCVASLVGVCVGVRVPLLDLQLNPLDGDHLTPPLSITHPTHPPSHSPISPHDLGTKASRLWRSGHESEMNGREARSRCTLQQPKPRLLPSSLSRCTAPSLCPHTLTHSLVLSRSAHRIPLTRTTAHHTATSNCLARSYEPSLTSPHCV
jgi:hypothetical protein